MNPAEATSAHILERTTAGYRSSLVSHAVRVACKAVGIVVLARLVSPAQHGLFAMVSTFFFLLVLFRDFGLGAAAIQARTLDEEQLTTLWHAHAWLGFLLGALMLGLSPAIGTFFGEPATVPLAATVSAALVLIGLNAWPRALLARELRFTELNRIETSAALIGTAAMITTALFNGGAYAFAAFLLTSEFVCLVGAWRICRWRPHSRARWQSLHSLWRPASDLLAYNILQCVQLQIDTLLMGRWFGASAAGFYNRPNQLLGLPITHIAAPLTQVLAASLSRLPPNSPQFASIIRQAANLLAYLTLPLAALCIVVPDDVVRLILGPDWPDAAPLLRWLAVGAAASYLTVTVYAVCFATAHTRRLAALTALGLIATVCGLWFARPHGPVGLAAALAIVHLALIAPRLFIATWQTPVALRDYASALCGPVAVTIIFMVGLTAARFATIDLHWIPRLVLSTAGGLLAASGLILSLPRLRVEVLRVWHHAPGRRLADANLTPPIAN